VFWPAAGAAAREAAAARRMVFRCMGGLRSVSLLERLARIVRSRAGLQG
jgi:hypothetical protein